MKTKKIDSQQVFVVKLWSAEHFGDKVGKRDNIFNGKVYNEQTKRTRWFSNAVELLNIIDEDYRKEEKNRN